MITVQSLSFSYGKGPNVLNDISFHVNRGSLYGFLGANGSGKTTTIRLMLGLCTPVSGEVHIDGVHMTPSSVSVFNKIGAMIEQPSLYGHLTGAENLYLNTLYHGTGCDNIELTLSLVGLKQVKNKRVADYSLGMKQRLGLALCLLHNPELLLLDEPLNGLDPKGMAEIRELLIRLVREEGKTVFMSSHLLGEVETTCDSICIIEKGCSVFSGTIEELRHSLVGRNTWSIGCNDPEKALSFLDNSMSGTVNPAGEGILVHTVEKESIPSLNKRLVEAGFYIYHITPVEQRLEELYLTLTNG